MIEALDMSYERSYSYLPVISSTDKRLLGYLTAEQLQKAQLSSSSNTVKDHYIRFLKPEKSGRKYQKITPNTPLQDLESFLKNEQFAIVTDEQSRFVLGVATQEDLDKYNQHRPAV